MKKLLLTLLFIKLFFVGSFAQQNGQIVIDPDNPARMVYHNTYVNDNGVQRFKPCVFVGPGEPENIFYLNGALSPTWTKQCVDFLVSKGARCTYITAYLGDFGGGSPGTGSTLDATLVSWEGFITQLENAGIITVFFFFDDTKTRPSTWQTDVAKIVNKFEHHKLLIWSVAEEYGEALTVAQASEVAALIKAEDNNKHVVGIHQNSSASFAFNNDNNMEMFLIQYNVTTADAIHTGMVSAWNNVSGNKVLNLAEVVDHAKKDAITVRQWNWAAVMGGVSAVQVYLMGRPTDNITWNEDAKYTDAKVLMDFMESIPDFNDMVPSDNLKSGGTKWVLARNGVSYIAYSPSLSGKIGISNISAGTYNLKWLDIATGNKVEETVTLPSGITDFTKPSSIGNEVAVYIKSTIDDTEAPTVPSGLASINTTSSTIELSWVAATDNIGVAGYIVTYNGTEKTFNGTVTSAILNGLTASISYTITIKAIDGSGNKSGESTSIIVVTKPVGSNPPSISSIADQTASIASASINLTLTDISDGDGMTQIITLSASSADESIAEIIGITYIQGQTTAVLEYKPVAIGVTSFTVIVTDNDATVNKTFNVSVTGNTDKWSYMVQAEDYNSISGTVWKAETSATGFTGTSYMTTTGGGTGAMNFNVDFPEAGTYYVYLRQRASDSNSNGVHMDLDGVSLSNTSTNVGIYCIKTNSWNYASQWQFPGESAHCGPLDIQINSAGQHTITLKLREANYKVDKIIIVKDMMNPPGKYCGTFEPIELKALDNVPEGYSNGGITASHKASSESNSQIEIYPNPASSDYFFIEGENNATVKIYNSNVLELLTKKINAGTSQISIDGYEAGIYLINIIDESGNTYSSKLVIR